MVTVEFVLSFEGSEHGNIGVHVDNVIDNTDYPRFGNLYFKKMKYNRVLTTIVYTTHQVDDDQHILSRSGQ